MKVIRNRFFVLVLLGIYLMHECKGQDQDDPSRSQSINLDSPKGETQKEGKTYNEVEKEINEDEDLEKHRNPSKGEDDNHSTDEDAKVHEDEGNTGDDQKEENYGEGSVCVYCQYCKFCKLCDKDCPCKTSKKKPNCHMCKYCKYCYLCSNVCDNFCKPGSFLDTVSSAFWSALPKFDNKMKGEVEKDIESVKDWIKSYL
ncbi:sarcoplasmic reticulum histidine-rich calcium-binding protein-like [Rhopilema esculentum]|uniref:sarcoplasmic reticulum histidine-rich calcium-binding protein-like n=1 Tax=Rhopilema esculentum TaxID=499914 RepID=UPI0031D2520E|eukprot:gene13285-4122_t